MSMCLYPAMDRLRWKELHPVTPLHNAECFSGSTRLHQSDTSSLLNLPETGENGRVNILSFCSAACQTLDVQASLNTPAGSFSTQSLPPAVLPHNDNVTKKINRGS